MICAGKFIIFVDKSITHLSLGLKSCSESQHSFEIIGANWCKYLFICLFVYLIFLLLLLSVCSSWNNEENKKLRYGHDILSLTVVLDYCVGHSIQSPTAHCKPPVFTFHIMSYCSLQTSSVVCAALYFPHIRVNFKSWMQTQLWYLELWWKKLLFWWLIFACVACSWLMGLCLGTELD